MSGKEYRRTGYHEERPAWRGRTSPVGFKVGIELEMEHPNHYRNILSELPLFKRNRPITEQDGSLNYDRGVEIVFPPYSVASLKDKRGNFQRTVRAIEESGAEPTSNCGMHLNINTRGWGEQKRQVFTATLFLVRRQAIEMIGRRSLNNGYCSPMNTYMRGFNINQLYNFARGSHSLLVSPRVGRIEARYPAATFNLETINFNVYFLQCVEKFAGAHENAFHITDLTGEEASTVNANLSQFIKDNMPAGSRRAKLLRILSL